MEKKGSASPNTEALGESPGPHWKEGIQEASWEGGIEDVKAMWGSAERIQGDYYSKGRQRGKQRLLQVLLVLLPAKSSSLT